MNDGRFGLAIVNFTDGVWYAGGVFRRQACGYVKVIGGESPTHIEIHADDSYGHAMQIVTWRRCASFFRVDEPICDSDNHCWVIPSPVGDPVAVTG